MDLWHGLVLITSIHLLAAASPGPDFILVSQQTISNGKKAGLLCSVGIALGLSIHILYSAFGLAAIIANSANLLWVIKVLGGSYLIYLGWQGLKAKASSSEESAKPPAVKHSAKKMIGLGFLCNALNPKAPIYFVSLFTLVLSADMPMYQIAIYGTWIMVLQFAWFALVVTLLSRPRINQKFKQCGHWIDRVLGGAMIALGVKLMITRS
ncbi:LysE family translocator [Vibrio rumoiensis]|uniref:MFS transporter n=1 Tax=Vibrio rumoiensis 1S-45 TaxID=1188252 RepID=A0A1E5E4U7_9VIBR|nr:LysE family transporter [Vibrio rumoiensis]OEF28138.1 MFS transporter [Vibrio rumoiensis 1S-45]